MQRRGKIFLFSGAALALTSLCLFLFFYHPQKLLEVDFLSVGQGDAELIKTPYGQNILIDGGPDNKVLAELGRNLPMWDRKIDLIINTHPHDDHVSGLIDVSKKYQVQKILMSRAESNAPPFEEFLKTIVEKKTPVTVVAGAENITLGPDLVLQIIHPGKNDIGADLNEDSIVARLIYKKEAFLFTGDAGDITETELLAEKINVQANVLKVGHHGSETSSGLDFLRAVSPQIAVIECGANNQFGFPKADTLWRLAKAGAEIFRTDLNGTVKIKTNGLTLRVKNKINKNSALPGQSNRQTLREQE
ncbi:MAG TPA: ComEC/Rec2 family competence protein [Candidatus Nanoarchaeia archaeon]|nr:ComEC/Rec2 family competence protein [Candidatus Nanoarchaeia archaeon]